MSNSNREQPNWATLEQQFSTTSSGTPNRETARQDLRSLGIEPITDVIENCIEKLQP